MGFSIAKGRFLVEGISADQSKITQANICSEIIL